MYVFDNHMDELLLYQVRKRNFIEINILNYIHTYKTNHMMMIINEGCPQTFLHYYNQKQFLLSTDH